MWKRQVVGTMLLIAWHGRAGVHCRGASEQATAPMELYVGPLPIIPWVGVTLAGLVYGWSTAAYGVNITYSEGWSFPIQYVANTVIIHTPRNRFQLCRLPARDSRKNHPNDTILAPLEASSCQAFIRGCAPILWPYEFPNVILTYRLGHTLACASHIASMRPYRI